jgi:hypothetical protein
MFSFAQNCFVLSYEVIVLACWIKVFILVYMMCDNTKKLSRSLRVLQQDQFGDTNGCIDIRSTQQFNLIGQGIIKNIIQLGMLSTIFIHSFIP